MTKDTGRSDLKLLLIEDVSSDADLINYELRKANISFVSKCVATKQEFLAELQNNPPDAIISDFSMPQFNALDALQTLKAHHVDVPFILVTGSQSEEVAVECIKEGADDYILKSSLTRLPTALRSAVSKKRAEHERERAEIALRRSEEYFRSLIENSSDLITIISEDGTIRFQSPSLERTLGYKPEQLVGRKLLEFIHPNDAAELESFIARELKAGDGVKPVEYRFRLQDGRWRFLESFFKNAVKNPAVSGIVINSRDITKRKMAEDQILEQAALLNKAQDAIMVIDLEETITFWNRSAEKLYGWPSEQVIGKERVGVLHPEGSEMIEKPLRQAIAKGDWQGELSQCTRERREIVVESRWSLVRDQDNAPRSILIINSDITERKKLEAHFMRAQRMESIGTLAGGIAHDLNNVLTPILMSLKLLRDLKNEAPEELLDTLEASAHRGAAIVQQVLSFARGVEGEKTILQVKHPLTEVIKIAKDIFPPGIQIQAKIGENLWPVKGDPTQIHQVLMNLFVNAKDAMPRGGRLQVEAVNSIIDENYARMQPDAHAGHYVVISVADTGSGISPEILPKIFEPFFTTKEVGKGTGLGLSTVAGIIRSHGGFLTVYSELGKGTCFKAHLPSVDVATEQPKAEDKTPLPLGNGETILVVDDEVAIREIIKVTLENNGYKVCTANDGTEAVAVVAARKTPIKVAIVDIMMPYMDGPATVRAVQRLNPKVKFIAISGLMDNEKIAGMSEAECITFLAKPFTTEQILNTLHKLLRSKAAR